MILDRGVCNVLRKTNIAPNGKKPVYEYTPIYSSWYAEVSYGSEDRGRATMSERNGDDAGGQELAKFTAKVRILQSRDVSNQDVAELTPGGGKAERFEIVKVSHGTDEDNGEMVTDLVLTELEAIYDA